MSISPKHDKYKKLIGEKIAEVRKPRGYSQAQLSYDAEIDLSTLSRLERGKLNFTIDTILKIADVLKVDPLLLLDPNQ